MKAREKAHEKWQTTMREEVICERCGRTLKSPDLFNRPGGWATVGVWQDEDEPERKEAYGYTFDLCDGCLATIREEFEIKRIGASTSTTLQHVVEEARVHLKLPEPEDKSTSGAFLHAYLALENVMFTLDEEGDETRADMLRDALDPVWRCLSANDHRLLNARGTNARGTITTKANLYRGLEAHLHPKPPAAACACEELRRLARARKKASEAAKHARDLWTALGEDVWQRGGHVYGDADEDDEHVRCYKVAGGFDWHGQAPMEIANVPLGDGLTGPWKRDEMLVSRLALAHASVRLADQAAEDAEEALDESIARVIDEVDGK